MNNDVQTSLHLKQMIIAAALVYSLAILAIFLLMQRYFIAGMLAGSVKEQV